MNQGLLTPIVIMPSFSVARFPQYGCCRVLRFISLGVLSALKACFAALSSVVSGNKHSSRFELKPAHFRQPIAAMPLSLSSHDGVRREGRFDPHFGAARELKDLFAVRRARTKEIDFDMCPATVEWVESST
jgi:hypothetical protein